MTVDVRVSSRVDSAYCSRQGDQSSIPLRGMVLVRMYGCVCVSVCVCVCVRDVYILSDGNIDNWSNFLPQC